MAIPFATSAFQDAQPGPPPPTSLDSQPPPVRLTNAEDHKRLMDLLRMTSIRRGRDGNNKDSPYYANLDFANRHLPDVKAK